MRYTRLAAALSGAALLASVVGCASTPITPVATYPASTTVTTYPAVAMEFGRVTNIEYLPAGTNAPMSGNSILGAVVGGLAGAALGNQIARNQSGATTAPGYRITVQTDQGLIRTYEVPATGDLHVGDRVRVDGGVIYRG